MTTQSNVSTLPAVQQRRSILNTMANSYGMEPAAFEATVRATCMKPDRKTGAVPSREEFAAFLLVAKEFDLNPLTKEIYAFPAKGGGIIPIVSIDGWCNLINSNKNFNGMNFEIEEGKDGKPLSCTCTIYRKDRDRDIIVTEYFSECRRDTDPWKSHPRRMLRHKALIQCARYAFGFAGIYDEDEGSMTTQSNVSTLPAVQQRRSILNTMANSYGMEPAAFEATVRATCMKPDRKTGAVPSREEFAAFLLVAKEFDLNPLTKEIYAFPAKGGGIIPIVSIDGWCNLINSNKNFNGMNFEIEEGKDGKPLSCTCTIYRKDRDRDIIVTEYFSECRRDTDPWKSHPRRMLRHKALIQCARYAFGFAGIYDEDEAERIAKDGVNTVIVQEPPAPPPPPAEIEGPAREPEETQEQDNQPEQEPVETVDFEPLVAGFESDAATALSEDDLDEYFAGAREVLADMPQGS